MGEMAQTPPIPPEASKEIEFIRGLVGKRFPVYDVRVTYDVVEFFVRVEPTTLEENFELLREEMARNGYIPMIVYDKGEHIITVAKKPAAKFRSISVNLAMLVITFIAMLIAGAINWAGYENVPSNQTFSADSVLMGIITFTLPLMAILGVHELAHYFMARRRRIAASLPFFIPSIPPLGTFGAFISLREPIPNKKTLLEIGVAGPLAGMLLAIPLAILGLVLTNDGAKIAPQNIPSSGALGLTFPLILDWLRQLVPINGDYLIHPTLFAAWVGFLVTALNLLPVGQLDGGHVARALLGHRARYVSWVTIAILVVLGYFYLAWLLFAVLILFLGARHPPPLNDITKLDVRRKAVGIIAFAVLVIAFVPIPLVSILPTYTFEMTPQESTNATIAPGETHLFTFNLTNDGNAFNDIGLTMDSAPPGWQVEFKQKTQNDSAYSTEYAIGLNSSQSALLDVLVTSSSSASLSSNATVVVKGTSENLTSATHTITYNFTVVNPTLTYWIVNNSLTIPRGAYGNVTIQVNNTTPGDSNITVNATDNQVPFVSAFIFNGTGFVAGPVNLSVPGNGNLTFRVEIYIAPPMAVGEHIVYVGVYYHGLTIDVLQIIVNVT